MHWDYYPLVLNYDLRTHLLRPSECTCVYFIILSRIKHGQAAELACHVAVQTRHYATQRKAYDVLTLLNQTKLIRH